MKRSSLRAGALLCATTLLSLGMAPAIADHSPDPDVIAQADATALILGIGGQEGFDSGTFTATHDGESESTSGTTQPAIGVLDNQDLLDIGTLAQQATAGLDGRDGVSAACSGVAGDGATLVEVGDSDCITGGDNIEVNVVNLDLSEVDLINEESALAPLAEINGIGQQLLGQITGPLSDALAETPLGTLNIGGTIGAVEAFCQAAPGTASGSANIANGQLGITYDGTQVKVLDLPVNPPPNTKVVTDLDEVLLAITAGVRTDLENTFDGALAPLAAVLAPLEENIINTIVAQVSDQLAPLEENILDITLNKQETFHDGAQIDVTGIDLQVLPAAAEAIGASFVDAQIANVGCGPNSVFTPAGNPDEPGDGPGAGPAPEPDLPEVPTVIDSGAAGAENGQAEAAIAGVLLLAGIAGLVGYRRLVAGS